MVMVAKHERPHRRALFEDFDRRARKLNLTARARARLAGVSEVRYGKWLEGQCPSNMVNFSLALARLARMETRRNAQHGDRVIEVTKPGAAGKILDAVEGLTGVKPNGDAPLRTAVDHDPHYAVTVVGDLDSLTKFLRAALQESAVVSLTVGVAK
jgi:hypothetical protein